MRHLRPTFAAPTRSGTPAAPTGTRRSPGGVEHRAHRSTARGTNVSRGGAGARRSCRRCPRRGAAPASRHRTDATRPPAVRDRREASGHRVRDGLRGEQRAHAVDQRAAGLHQRRSTASMIRCCSTASSATSLAVMRQRASARRRRVPSPLHGASMSTWSNAAGSERRGRRIGRQRHDVGRAPAGCVLDDETDPLRLQVGGDHRRAGGGDRRSPCHRAPHTRRAPESPSSAGTARGDPLRTEILDVAVVALGDRRAPRSSSPAWRIASSWPSSAISRSTIQSG